MEFTDLIEIHILELPKSLESLENSDSHKVNLLNWLRFLRAETMEELDMVAEANPMIAKTVVKVLELSEDERVTAAGPADRFRSGLCNYHRINGVLASWHTMYL